MNQLASVDVRPHAFTRLALSLADLDHLAPMDIAIFVFADSRPLQGVGGLIDWRLCGRISRLILSGKFKGSWQETLLFPVLGRFGPRRMFLFGLGDSSNTTTQTTRHTISNAVLHATTVLNKSQAKTYAVVLPGISTGTDTQCLAAMADTQASPSLVLG